MEQDSNFYVNSELNIGDNYYYVTYNLPKDRMTLTLLLDEKEAFSKSPNTFVAEGFEEFCNDNNYLVIGSRSWSYELDGYDESEMVISLKQLISDWDVEPAIRDFITSNYGEQLLNH